MNKAPCPYEQENMIYLVGEFYMLLSYQDIPFKRLEEILGYFSKVQEEFPGMEPDMSKVIDRMGSDLVKAKHDFKYQ